MSDASDIILLTVGAGVACAITAAVMFALWCCKRKNKKEKLAVWHRLSDQFYVNTPPAIGREKSDVFDAHHNNNSALVQDLEAVLVAPRRGSLGATEVHQLSVEKINEAIAPVHRPSILSLKRLKRPSNINVEPSGAKLAAKALAIQTEHKVSEFVDVMIRLGIGRHRLMADEFQILEQVDELRVRKCEIAEQNRSKNRFADILPFDETRVILRGKQDYINASLVDGHGVSGQFIATQTPIGIWEAVPGKIDETMDDFWRMVYEKQVQCIVMLNEVNEDLRYWPKTVGKQEEYGGFRVELRSETHERCRIRREFDLFFDGTVRKITHYQVTGWRDSEKAPNPKDLTSIIRAIRRKSFDRPIVVHCCAGVGRTGVFLALWRLLDRARQEGLIDIFQAVDECRQQRCKMVQNLDQYEGLYEAMLLAVVKDHL